MFVGCTKQKLRCCLHSGALPPAFMPCRAMYVPCVSSSGSRSMRGVTFVRARLSLPKRQRRLGHTTRRGTDRGVAAGRLLWPCAAVFSARRTCRWKTRSELRAFLFTKVFVYVQRLAGCPQVRNSPQGRELYPAWQLGCQRHAARRDEKYACSG